MKLNISNIQHFSVGDGDGIRTTVFFKGCNLRCPWCHNPENLSTKPTVLRYAVTAKSEVCGRLVTVDEILPELLEDREFYESSGGGVTLSGGEVMLQAEGAALLSLTLSKENISVLIDTAGCVPYSEFEKLNSIVHGYLYDFKTADPLKYESIGGNLETVTKNLRRLMSDGKNVRVRIPLIPEFNANAEEVLCICRYLSDMGVASVEILPFHRLGTSKYEAMEMEYSYRNTEPLSREIIKNAETVFKEYFEAVSVYK